MANAMLNNGFRTSSDSLASQPAFVLCDKKDDARHGPFQHDPEHHDDNESSPSGRTTLRLPSSLTSAASLVRLGRKKSVDFSLHPAAMILPSSPPQPKRIRHTEETWTAKQVVDAISTCISQRERLEAIDKARDTFDHDVQLVHDDEMSTGADSVLVKHLTFLVYHHLQQEHLQKIVQEPTTNFLYHFSLSSSWQEISKTCHIIECLYRASSEIVGASFRRMGQQTVFVLVQLIEHEVARRYEVTQKKQKLQHDNVVKEGQASTKMSVEDNNWREQHYDQENVDDEYLENDEEEQLMHSAGDVLLKKATKLLGHFARVGEATKTLAHFPGLLKCFIRLIKGIPYASLPWEARLSALWTLANLACNHENMQMMVCTPGLVDSLIEIACRPLHHGDALEHIVEVLRSRAIACRAVLNLSWAPENKIILAENVALIDLLAELAVHRVAPLVRSRTVRDIVNTTRRHAVGALRNMAAAPRRTKLFLCEYKSGHLLNILTDAALNDPDSQVKERSFAAIHNLAIQDTAERIVSHPALVLALRSVLVTDSSTSEHQARGIDALSSSAAFVEHDDTCKKHASATLMVLERTITPDKDSYESLRELLEIVNPTPANNDAYDNQECCHRDSIDHNHLDGHLHSVEKSNCGTDDMSSSDEMNVVQAMEV